MKLVWFSEIRWDYLVTRKQQILSRFSAHWRILFIEPYVVGKQMHLLPVRRGNIVVVTIPFLKTIPSGPLRLMQDLRLVQILTQLIGWLWLKFILRITGFHTPERVIGLSNAYWGPLAARLPAKVKFYDCNDDHLAFPHTPTWLKQYLVRYLKFADLVFVVSDELGVKVQRLGFKSPILLGNGVNYDLFAQQKPNPSEIKEWPKPILGYAGAMDWLDENLLELVADSFKAATLVLIGPFINTERRDQFRNVLERQNVKYLGPKPHSELPAWVQAFNVALLPFRKDELTAVLNPNKLYEYIAAGTPVVSLDFSQAISRLEKIIYVASTHEEFINKINKAISDERKPQPQLFAKQYDWNEVARRMEIILAEHIGKG